MTLIVPQIVLPQNSWPSMLIFHNYSPRHNHLGCHRQPRLRDHLRSLSAGRGLVPVYQLSDF